MIQLHTAAECRQADRKAIDDCCIPSASLMEEASCAAASILMNRLDRHERILFVAGCGNNGGDALATARIMYTHGYDNISLFLHEGRQSDDRALQLLICQRLGMRCVETMEGYDCIVDGLLGAGLSGAVRPAEQGIIHSINSASCPFVVSLDVPSGICDDFHCDEPVKADLTITFGSDKTSLHALGNRRFTKEIVTIPLSYPADAFAVSSVSLASVQDYRRLELPADSYKVSRGRVAVLGGSRQYMGAMRLAAKAAFKAGCGMVTLFTDPSLVELASAECGAEVMVRPFSDFHALAATFDSVLMGPGLGLGDEARALVEEVCSMPLRTLILDADAIRLYPGTSKASSLVLTPHVGEYRSLGGLDGSLSPDGFYAELEEMARRLCASIVLKAECVYVCDGAQTSVVDGCNPSLGVAGSGDVLAGMVAAVLAGGDGEVLDAVLLHQLAGRRLHEKAGFYTASELVDEIGVLR